MKDHMDQFFGAVLCMPSSALGDHLTWQDTQGHPDPVLEQVHWHTRKAWLERPRKEQELLL